MRRQQSIYDKLAKYSKVQEKPKTALSKSKKHNFKNHKLFMSTFKVMLNTLDDIFTKLESGAFDVQVADDVFQEAVPRIKEAKDILEYGLVDYEAGIEGLNEIKRSLDEIGIPYPDRVVEMEELIERVKESFDKTVKGFQDLGVSIDAQIRVD